MPPASILTLALISEGNPDWGGARPKQRSNLPFMAQLDGSQEDLSIVGTSDEEMREGQHPMMNQQMPADCTPLVEQDDQQMSKPLEEVVKVDSTPLVPVIDEEEMYRRLNKQSDQIFLQSHQNMLGQMEKPKEKSTPQILPLIDEEVRFKEFNKRYDELYLQSHQNMLGQQEKPKEKSTPQILPVIDEEERYKQFNQRYDELYLHSRQSMLIKNKIQQEEKARQAKSFLAHNEEMTVIENSQRAREDEARLMQGPVSGSCGQGAIPSFVQAFLFGPSSKKPRQVAKQPSRDNPPLPCSSRNPNLLSEMMTKVKDKLTSSSASRSSQEELQVESQPTAKKEEGVGEHQPQAPALIQSDLSSDTGSRLSGEKELSETRGLELEQASTQSLASMPDVRNLSPLPSPKSSIQHSMLSLTSTPPMTQSFMDLKDELLVTAQFNHLQERLDGLTAERDGPEQDRLMQGYVRLRKEKVKEAEPM